MGGHISTCIIGFIICGKNISTCILDINKISLWQEIFPLVSLDINKNSLWWDIFPIVSLFSK